MERLLIKTAKEAGKLLMENFENNLALQMLEQKNRFDYSIMADKMAEDYILKMIKENGVKCKIITEETGTISLGETGYTIFIDPLDGTLNYSRGIPHFCVSIGLQKNNDMIFGVVYDPYRKELFLAEKDKGAFLNKKKISVSEIKDLKNCFCIFEIDYRNVRKNLFLFNKISDSVLRMRIGGCAGLDLCYVACGRVDIFIDFNLMPWDIAAAGFIVEEAGGTITDNVGNAWNPYNKHIVASNGRVHEEVLKIVGE
jgi:myo-inositol-1(or 4)-monophosphatase